MEPSLVAKDLARWEQTFANALRAISEAQRGKTGALLSVIPSRDAWELFVADVRAAWPLRESVFLLKPACLVLFYDGVAFYEYTSGNFWDGFAKMVGEESIPGNKQIAINREFVHVAQRFGLPVTPHDFVGSSVAHIGIPISMWDGFLQVCEWALWHQDWSKLDDNAWRDALHRRLGGRTLLINFLVKNRPAASDMIRDMLDVRRLLAADPKLTIELAQASILRREYFDEVPETADFLREHDPESLFADRARLAWNEERATLSLYLPPVAKAKLPATWRLGERRLVAASTASELVVQAAAFTPVLRLELESHSDTGRQRISGIDGWALYDEVRGRFVNRDRDILPVAQYALISHQPLKPELEGWAHDSEDPATDIAHQLADGTPIFITRLYAESRRPRLKIGDGRWLTFAQRRGVALRLFCGAQQSTAARFSIATDGTLRVEDWPRPFLEVPLSLMRDDDVPEEFSVFLDGKRAHGKWQFYDYDSPDENSAERSFWRWKWENPPLPLPPKPPVVCHSLAALDLQKIGSSAPSWIGCHVLHVESRRLGRIPFGRVTEFKLEMLSPTPDKLWPKSWGDFLVWILLSQVQDEATWEEVRFAGDAIAPWAKFKLSSVYHMIRKLERHGFLVARGHRYRDFRSRIALITALKGEMAGEYCGLTTSLYEVIRATEPLRISIEPAPWGHPPTLRIYWLRSERGKVEAACKHHGIQCVNKLW